MTLDFEICDMIYRVLSDGCREQALCFSARRASVCWSCKIIAALTTDGACIKLNGEFPLICDFAAGENVEN